MIGRAVHNLWTVYRLQGQCTRLDLKANLLRPASPLVQATARSLPGFGLWAGRVLTVVLREGGRGGFVQARWRTGVPALDLLGIAPSLHTQPGAAWLWQRLVQELAREGAVHGVQRLFAHLPEHHHGEIEVMRQSGFALYGQDGLYRLDWLPRLTARPPRAWRERAPVDEWGLTRLYVALTPPLVQQAENMLHAGGGGYASWWGGPRHGGWVLRGAVAGDVDGFLRVTRGERAHWLKLVLRPDRAANAPFLLEQALGLMVRWPPRPIFCDVRAYEGVVAETLEAQGFRLVMARALLVRQISATVRRPVARVYPIPEAAPEGVPTPF